MSHPSMSRLISIKVEEDLAALLNALPNKSEFIRTAILATGRVACPLCDGTGVVYRGIHDHFAEVLDQHQPLPPTNRDEQETASPN